MKRQDETYGESWWEREGQDLTYDFLRWERCEHVQRLKGRSQLQGRDMKDPGGGESGTAWGSEQVGRDKICGTERISA